MSRHQIHVTTSHTVAHVATSNPCRDVVSAHSGISRSRRQAPGCDLPRCYPCCDLKNDVATSNQFSPISATSRHHSSMSRRPLRPLMSRPHNDVATSSSIRQPESGRDINLMSRHQFPVPSLATPNMSSAQPGHDFHILSRPQPCLARSQRHFPCRDLGLFTPCRD